MFINFLLWAIKSTRQFVATASGPATDQRSECRAPRRRAPMESAVRAIGRITENKDFQRIVEVFRSKILLID